MSGFDWPRDNAELVAQLAKQRDRYEQLVSNMSDLLLLIEPDGTVSYCNRCPELPPGAAVYPAAGTEVLAYVGPADRQVVADALRDVLAGRVALREVLFRIGAAAAGERVIEGALTPVHDDGKVVQVEFLGRDVTERQRAEQALRQAHAALTRRQNQLQRDLDVAAKIHASLLPAPLRTDRILIDLKHRPLLGVGGDYVYIHRHDPLRPAVVVFDVSGHGIASALVANRVHSAVYAILNQGAPPPEMVSRLNRFIYDSFSDLGIFVTLFGMQLDLPAGQACYCGSGHPPALLQRGGSGDIVPLESAHLPIGVATNAFIGEPMRTVGVEPGDTIWLYTDGLIELRGPQGEMLGINGLTERLRRLARPADPQPGLAGHCLDQLLAGCEDPDDDVTLVLAAIR